VTKLVLDTNVLSELSKNRPEQPVVQWVLRQELETVYLTSTVLGEISAGIETMPAGKRKETHRQWLNNLAEVQFAGRILPYDLEAARLYGRLIARSYARGRPPGVADAQIAAVAALHGMAVATRDIDGFEPFGLPLVNPWE
jgi:toxin FitB